MTFLTTVEADKAIYAMMQACWNAQAGAVAGYVPDIRYEGDERGALPGADKFWAFAETTEVTGRQAGHQCPDEPDGSPVVYTTYGFVTFTIYAPMKPGCWEKGQLLSTIGKRMFMASETGGSIWFRNPRANKLKKDGTFYRWNVIADYQFDEVKGS